MLMGKIRISGSVEAGCVITSYSIHYTKLYDIVEKPALITFDQVDTVCITKSLSFQQIISASGTTDALFRWLNPSYTKSFIPVYDKPVCIFLPKANIPAFVRAEKSLKNQEAPLAVANPVGSTEGRVKQYHIVGKGEFFHKIAIDYSCRISVITSYSIHYTKLYELVFTYCHHLRLPKWYCWCGGFIDYKKVIIPRCWLPNNQLLTSH